MRKLFRPLYFLKHICYILKTNPIRTLIYGIVVILFVVEVLIYHCMAFSWYAIKCENDKNCTRILLAADPQLIGIHNEPIKSMTPISIWDSDRYLAKTFSHAFQFTNPNVVIFLGDLFDEGSTAGDDEFKTYHYRLLNIFVKERYSSANYIWMPGDNDIGGEGNDRLTEYKVKRFEQTFPQPDILSFKNVKFYKINELTSLIPKVKDVLNNNLNNIVVGISHMPLLNRGTHFVEKVLHTLRPHLFFTAHTHQLRIFKAVGDSLAEVDNENKVYEYELTRNNTNVYDIGIPTCSYRMGTKKIGYGFAVIENKSIRYTILWSPNRLGQLKFYEILVLFIWIYLICIIMYRKLQNCCTRNK